MRVAKNHPGSAGKKHTVFPSVILCLGLTCLIIVVNHRLEHTTVGQWFRLKSYELLQIQLGQQKEPQNPRIVVVDVKDLPSLEVKDEKALVASRANLREILVALHAAGARAVAIDINFAPKEDQSLSIPEKRFIEWCADWENNGTIYLASGNRIHMNREHWWGGPDAADVIPDTAKVAVHALVPTRENLASPSHDEHESRNAGPAPVRIVPMNIFVSTYESTMPSLAKALATAPKDFGKRPKELTSVPSPLSALFEQFTETRRVLLEEPYYLETSFFPVNYGVLRSLQKNAVPAIDARGIKANASRFRDALVVIGRSTADESIGSDWHVVPGHDQQVAGVFVHACAVWSLGEGAIFAPTTFGRYVIDFSLSLLVLAVTLSADRSLAKHKASHRTLRKLAPWLIAGLAFVVGVICVRWTRLLWDDFAFVLFGVAILHPWMHSIFEALSHGAGWLRKQFSRS